MQDHNEPDIISELKKRIERNVNLPSFSAPSTYEAVYREPSGDVVDGYDLDLDNRAIQEIEKLRNKLEELQQLNRKVVKHTGWEGIGYESNEVVLQCRSCGFQQNVSRSEWESGKYDWPHTKRRAYLIDKKYDQKPLSKIEEKELEVYNNVMDGVRDKGLKSYINKINKLINKFQNKGNS